MIALSTEDSIIQVALGAAAAPDLRWSASYVKVQIAYTSSPQVQEKTVTVDGQTSGVAPVDITPAIEGTDYWLRFTGFYIRNSGAGAQTVIVRKTASSGAFNILQSISLDPGSHLIYNEESGWQTITSAGAAPAPGSGVFLQAANNLSDVASALTSFNNIKQLATEVFSGVAEIATQVETDAGIDDTRFVTPLKFQTRLAAYAQPLDSDLTNIAGLTPANDDIIQRKAGAWTNRTIAQYYSDLQSSVKNDVYFTIYFEHGNIAAPADATTYYFGALTNATPSATSQDRKIAWDFGDCTLIAATIGARAGTGGTAGVNNSLYFRLNDTTDTTLSTTISYSVTGTVQTYTATGLSTNITNGDFFEMKLVTGTWASNPVNIGTSGYLLFKRR